MKIEWKSCFKIGVSVFLLYLCISYWKKLAGLLALLLSAASPLIIGCVIAYIVNILMSVYERHLFAGVSKGAAIKARRPLALVLAFVTLAGIIVLIFHLVVPHLVSCVKLLIDKLPGAIEKAIGLLDNFEIIPQDIIVTLSSIDWQSRIGELINVVTSGVGNVMNLVINTVSTVFSAIVTAFLSIIFAVYLLLGKDKLGAQLNRVMKHYLPVKWRRRIIYAASVFNDCFHRYIVGQCTEAVILGCLCVLGMTLLQLPYAAMIGALIAFTALIPIAGAYIGAGVGAFMIAMVSPVKALIFLVFIVVLQQIEGNLIYPRVVGSSMGLPGIWVLAAVTVGGGVMGIPGMLLGVPLAAALYRIIQNDMNSKKPFFDDVERKSELTE